jgi:putative oxidoreductase
MTSPSVVSPKQSGFLSSAYCRFLHFAARLDTPFLLVVRIIWGWQFTIDGWGKLHNLGRVTGFFSTLPLPFPGASAVLVSAMEFVGGLLLIAGLGTRVVGLLLAANMMMAYFAVSEDRTAFLTIFSNDPSTFVKADPFPFLCAAVVALVFGAGTVSLDYLLAMRRK